MSEVNNLTQQLLFLKDKLSKLENKNTQEEKKKDEINDNITDSSESQIVNDHSPIEDDLPIKRKLTQNSIEEIDIQHKKITTLELDNQKKKRGKQTDREEKILTLYKCFDLKLFERKLRSQLKEEIIERLIHEFGIKVNDINEYKEIIKKTFKIKNENKREINRIMEEEIIKHQWKDKEIKEIISKMNKKEEIEEEEVMKIIKEEEMKEQEDVQFIDYNTNESNNNIINKNE
ncbi:hypothetical protein ENUP19_0335G0001 [Entamoeba nuttalli]|uniref:Uncharacterized protein n=1 Tax=Entamoeba nuttalli TaxID=412467 RepID=A0ABQ0DWW0_9EUKA